MSEQRYKVGAVFRSRDGRRILERPEVWTGGAESAREALSKARGQLAETVQQLGERCDTVSVSVSPGDLMTTEYAEDLLGGDSRDQHSQLFDETLVEGRTEEEREASRRKLAEEAIQALGPNLESINEENLRDFMRGGESGMDLSENPDEVVIASMDDDGNLIPGTERSVHLPVVRDVLQKEQGKSGSVTLPIGEDEFSKRAKQIAEKYTRPAVTEARPAQRYAGLAPQHTLYSLDDVKALADKGVYEVQCSVEQFRKLCEEHGVSPNGVDILMVNGMPVTRGCDNPGDPHLMVVGTGLKRRDVNGLTGQVTISSQLRQGSEEVTPSKWDQLTKALWPASHRSVMAPRIEDEPGYGSNPR